MPSERQREGIDRAKAAGVYGGRKPTVDVASVRDILAHALQPRVAEARGVGVDGTVGDVSEAPVEPDTRYGDIQTLRVADRATLLTILRDSGNPNSGKWMLIRSLVTCRAVFYGHDGQAFVCLPSEVAPILSPNNTLINVEECSHLLAETDWMDGLMAF